MNLLDAGNSSFASKLIIPGLNPDVEESGSRFQPEPKAGGSVPWKLVSPIPGFCLKSKTLEGDKVFINIGHTDGIPPPDDISNEELIAILESEDKAGFKVPMSIGDAHIETDKSDNLCTVYDVVINSVFIEKVKTNELFKGFFVYVTLQAVMEKYGFELDLNPSPGYVILKNRKCMGKMRDHRIEQRATKKHSRPLIEELSSSEVTPSHNPTSLKEDAMRKQGDPCNLYQFPKEGKPTFYLASVTLPVSSTSSDVSLSIGEDRILLTYTKSGQIIADKFFPLLVDPKTASAVFNDDSKMLLVKVEIAKENALPSLKNELEEKLQIR